MSAQYCSRRASAAPLSRSLRLGLTTLGALAISVATVALSGCGKTAAQDTVRYGYPSSGLSGPTGPIGWALEKGTLQAALRTIGINHIVPLAGGTGPDLNEACAAGTVDVFLTGDTPGIIGRAAGLPIELVDVDITEANNYLFTLKDGPKRIEDLAGKRVPVLQGTNQMHFVYGVLASKGILNQVNFINLSSGATEPALIQGDIAAATSAYGPLMVSRGYHVLAEAKDYPGLSGNSPVVASESFLKAHPGFVTVWNRVRAEAIADMNAHPDDYYTFLASRIKQPEAILRETYPLSLYRPEPVPSVVLGDLESLKQFLVAQHIIHADFPIQSWIAPEAQSETPGLTQK